MGELIQLPNSREIPPEVRRLIKRRTKNASNWVRHWYRYRSVVYDLIDEMDSYEVDERIFDDIELYLLSYLTDRNRAALKARGF